MTEKCCEIVHQEVFQTIPKEISQEQSQEQSQETFQETSQEVSQSDSDGYVFETVEFPNNKAFKKYIKELLRRPKYKIDEKTGEKKWFKVVTEQMFQGRYMERKYPKHMDLSDIDTLAYAFVEGPRSASWNIKHWDVSNIIDFTGCFYDNQNVMSRRIKHWNVSKGLYFDYMFYNAQDYYLEKPTGFKHLRYWDCSNGVSYKYMFNTDPTVCYLDNDDYNNINYLAISKIKVNPNGDFQHFFRELPKEEAEHFRNWFPDMNIEEIIKKLL